MGTHKDIEQSGEGKILSSIDKQNKFSVPADYFDGLPEKITNRIQSGSRQKLFFFLQPAIAIPSLAILISIIALSVLLLNKNNAFPAEILLSDNDVQHIVDNPELYNIDDAVITEQYIFSNISDESINEESALPDDEVRSYLEENTNAQNIINEY
jgi:hypothetical protein